MPGRRPIFFDNDGLLIHCAAEESPECDTAQERLVLVRLLDPTEPTGRSHAIKEHNVTLDQEIATVEPAGDGVLYRYLRLQPWNEAQARMAWLERLIGHAAELTGAEVPVVLAGDYNVVPTVHDIYPTRSLDKNALIQPESRAALARLLAQGWTDALRSLTAVDFLGLRARSMAC